MLTFTVTFTVPELSDDTVWFANAQAWQNYWANADVADITLDPIATQIYSPVNYVTDGYVEMNIGGTNYQLAQESSLVLLAAKVAAIDTCLQTLRTELKQAGLITQAQ
jgi:hypothetical protein